jgi:signal transduction histidine kinase
MADELMNREEALRASFRLRRQMLADVSHELKTPLTVLRAYVETLVGMARRRSHRRGDLRLRHQRGSRREFPGLRHTPARLVLEHLARRARSKPIVEDLEVIERDARRMHRAAGVREVQQLHAQRRDVVGDGIAT